VLVANYLAFIKLTPISILFSASEWTF